MRFKNPQKASGVLGSGTASPTTSCRSGWRRPGPVPALNRLLLEAEDAEPGTVLDRAFIEEHTHGFEEFAADVRKTTWDEILDGTGLTREQIETVAARVRRSERIIVCWAMGLTQHKNSVPTIREVVNFLLLRGNIGRPGAGVCPVRGHSNVQGDRTMGIYEKPAAAFLDALGAEFGFAAAARARLRHRRGDPGDARRQGAGLLRLGGNFVAATPDTAVTEAAMRGCRLTVQVSTKLNRSHAVTGAPR
jgi:anaerobic selenocysteine-containing dehydrogenase